MKYKILIYKIEENTVTKRVWQKLYDTEAFEKIKEANYDADQYGYRETEGIEVTETKFYEQVRESDFDLKEVIDAFNKPKDA